MSDIPEDLPGSVELPDDAELLEETGDVPSEDLPGDWDGAEKGGEATNGNGDPI